MVRSVRLAKVTLAALTLGALLTAGSARAQLTWASKDGKASFKVGLLAQLQAESAENAGGDDRAKNLFLRRARILLSFDFGDDLSVFFETDSPNLGKAGANGTKNSGDIYVQDLVVSYRPSRAFGVDAGLVLPAASYNHTQSAATMLAVDYGPYSFLQSAPLGARVGRDYGAQARGYLAADRVEYRLGVFQGARGDGAANDLRVQGRVMLQLFTPQVGLFYRGTSLGKTRTLSFGASFDVQDDYRSFSGDVFWDQPLGGGNGLTLKGEYTHFDGGDLLPALARQDDLLLEAGFYFAGTRLMPFLQYASQDFDAPARGDEERFAAGLGFFPRGHNHTLKLSWGQVRPDGGKARDHWLMQWQVFLF